MLVPNIIKVTCGTDWILTFMLVDPYSKLPANKENTFVRFGLYEKPSSPSPIWSCAWDTGVQLDPVKPGVVHVAIPRSTSDYLPPGLYTYIINTVSKEQPTYAQAGSGTLSSIAMNPKGGIAFGVEDAIAREMIGAETIRAMTAEEEIRQEIKEGGDIPDGSVTTEKIADAAVTKEKIAEGVIPDPLPPNSVSTDMIRNDNVTTEKIADGAITAAKIAEGAITPVPPSPGSVGSEALADFAVTQNKLDPDLIQDVDEVAADAASLFEIGEVVSGIEPDVSLTHEQGKFKFNFALVPGETPVIDQSSKHWFIGDVDTGILAEGTDGVGISGITVADYNPTIHGQLMTITFTDGRVYNAVISQTEPSDPGSNSSIQRLVPGTPGQTAVINVSSANYSDVSNKIYECVYKNYSTENNYGIKFIIDKDSFTDFNNVVLTFCIRAQIEYEQGDTDWYHTVEITDNADDSLASFNYDLGSFLTADGEEIGSSSTSVVYKLVLSVRSDIQIAQVIGNFQPLSD